MKATQTNFKKPLLYVFLSSDAKFVLLSHILIGIYIHFEFPPCFLMVWRMETDN